MVYRSNRLDFFGLLRKCLLAFAILLVSYSTLAAEKKQSGWLLPQPFSAQMVEYDRAADVVISTGQLLAGKGGMRIESKGAPGISPPTIYIQNFAVEQVWILSPVHRRYAELPVDDESANEAEDDSDGGFMSTEPCQGISGKEKKNSQQWHALTIDVWHCRGSKDDDLVQYFSPLLGMVVREETQRGRVKELLQIQTLSEPDGALFLPPDNYYKVSVEEYLSGRIKLKRFQEQQK